MNRTSQCDAELADNRHVHGGLRSLSRLSKLIRAFFMVAINHPSYPIAMSFGLILCPCGPVAVRRMDMTFRGRLDHAKVLKPSMHRRFRMTLGLAVAFPLFYVGDHGSFRHPAVQCRFSPLKPRCHQDPEPGRTTFVVLSAYSHLVGAS